MREAKIHTPTNSSGGSTQDMMRPSAVSVTAPVNSTLCFSSSPASPGSTRTVLKLVLPFGSFSLSSPRITSPATVTFATLPSARYFWNWL